MKIKYFIMNIFSVFLIINISMAIYVYLFLYLNKINQVILTILGAKI